MFTGKLVVFFEHRVLAAGICLDESERRLRVLRENGATIQINEDRITYAVPFRINTAASSHEAVLQELQAFRQRRQILAAEVCAEKLWESLGEKGRLYDVSGLAGRAFSAAPGPEHEIAVMDALVQERVHFKLTGNKFLARLPEECERKKGALHEEARRQQECEQAVQWIRSVQEESEAHFEQRDAFISLLKDYVVFGKETRRYTDVRAILRRTTMTAPEDCFAFLVRLGVWNKDENILLHRYGLSSAWSQDCQREVEDVLAGRIQQVLGDPARRDVTDQYTVSIDEHLTRDVDDALCIRITDYGVEVCVHITDVASCIPPGSCLDREAFSRGASLYLPDGKIPMLPPRLSEQALSLTEGENRPAVSFVLKLRDDGTVICTEAFLSVVRVDRNLSYGDADTLMQNDAELKKLYAVAVAMRKYRLAQGASSLQLPELQVRVGDNNRITCSLRDKESPAQLLVAECMIAANYAAALLLQEHSVPALFRKQKGPRLKEHREPSGNRLFDLFSRRKQFGRVFFNVKPGRHSGLGLDCYTTVTSPVRKYSDLVCQRQIAALLRQEPPVFSDAALQATADALVPVIARNALIEQERKRYWLLKELQERKGCTLEAVVMNKRRNTCTIMLQDYLLEAPLQDSGAARLVPGDTVTVDVESVEPFAGTIKLHLH